MCGICGVVALDRPPETETVGRLAAALAHRGPDGSGFHAEPGVALGHLRLAIIDLSDGGLQPFPSADGALRLLHNGEVYNYRELRAELEGRGRRFRTATDTEVILAAYEEWGERCVERFNGMWAIALWDRRRRTLFCSRDRFGVKPFYYSLEGGRLVFASELKAFAAAGLTAELDRTLARDYLEQGLLDHTDGTFFAGIRKLPAAHSLTFGPDGLRLRRYWSLEPRDPPADPVGAVRELFLDSIRLRLRSDVPIGTALSGGLDSSAVACGVDALLRTERESALQVGERQRTFTAYFEDAGFDERPYAEVVVDRIGADARWISFSDADLVERIPEVVRAQDEPFGSTSIVAQWFVMRAAREAGVTVMLDGQGGDEVFAGYPVAFSCRFADLLRSARVADLRAELGAYRRLHGAGVAATAVQVARPFLPPGARRRLRARHTGAAALVHPSLRGLPATPERDGHVWPDFLRRQLHTTLTERGLPELLRYEDRNSMAHSLEARVPFLDYRLVETLFSLGGDSMIERGVTKTILRRALGDLLPPLVRDRVDKLGFVTPQARFLRGALGDLAAEVFASAELRERGLVDGAAALDRLERHRRGELEAGFELWRALNLELWAREFL